MEENIHIQIGEAPKLADFKLLTKITNEPLHWKRGSHHGEILLRETPERGPASLLVTCSSQGAAQIELRALLESRIQFPVPRAAGQEAAAKRRGGGGGSGGGGGPVAGAGDEAGTTPAQTRPDLAVTTWRLLPFPDSPTSLVADDEHPEQRATRGRLQSSARVRRVAFTVEGPIRQQGQISH
ncbi:unnamed protein product [Notodromas monacha]|uniref:Uncharacterized protein n=1 Tax=Notodromas monacha TaxID=399045 RepID=A0A7R9BF00_9CRUS|nr:unnamed protein product [Notodromas monacha]CAG0914172.1 unnamed protein product [Notodromas monacha]